MDFSNVLRFSYMHALDQISWISEQMLKVNKVVGKVSNSQHGISEFYMGSDNHNLQKCSW
jgi:hypothetical protein